MQRNISSKTNSVSNCGLSLTIETEFRGQFRYSAIRTHDSRTNRLCLIPRNYQGVWSEARRDGSEEKGGLGRRGEQTRRADVARLFQALPLLPGYSLSHTCPESLELHISSGFFFFFFRKELYTGRLGNVKKKRSSVRDFH